MRIKLKQKSRERKKKERKTTKTKSELCFLYVPPLYKRDIEMNLKTSWNSIFYYQNQLYTPSKNDEAADMQTHVKHVSTIFFKSL
jgi:hypothetical protein